MAASPQFDLIVLAAGLSRRMGGPNKLLHTYRGKPLLTHALETASHLDFADRVIVTGRDAHAIGELAAAFGMRSVHNARFAEGLGTSLAAGAAALRPGATGVFVALGDMPDVLPDDYRGLSSASILGSIALPVYKGTRGHPVLFCSSYIAQLQRLSRDEGARSILTRYAHAVLEIETANPGVLRDFDRPEDFGVEASPEKLP